MRNLISFIIGILVAAPLMAFAVPSSVDRITDRIEPLIKTDSIRGLFFTASSTTQVNTFPLLTATNATTTTLVNTGNVMIGTSTPLEELTIQSSEPGIALRDTDELSAAGMVIDAVGDLSFYPPTGGNLEFNGPIELLYGFSSSIIGDTDDTYSIGNSSRAWYDLWLGSTGAIYFEDLYTIGWNGTRNLLSLYRMEEIFDSSSDELLSFTQGDGNAVNNIHITNANTGLNPTIAATSSSDSNVGISIMPRGTGNVGIATTSPVSKLSVAGDAWFNGNATATNLTATGTLRIASLNGVLKAVSGAVSAAVAGTDYENPLTFSGALSRSVNAISCLTASGSVTGCLSSTDWTAFNGRVATTSIDTLAEIETLTGVSNILIENDIDASSELRGIMDDETGTGALMFGITSSMSDDISCGASQVLARNSGDSAWECVAMTGGGGGGGMSTSTDNNPQIGETISYISTDFYVGGSASNTAELNFDKDSATLTLSSTTGSGGFIGIGTTSAIAALNVEGSAFITGNATVTSITATGSATSSIANLSITGGISLLGEYFTNFTNYVRTLVSETITGITYNSGTGVFSLDAGYVIPLTASTTNWNSFYDTPSTRITAGNHIDWTSNTLDVVTTGDWTGTFDGQQGTWYIDRANHSGTQLAATISDFVSNVRTSISETITGLGYDSGTGVFSLDAGYVIPLTASTTEWDAFYRTPSTRITAGTGLSWSGNTLNASATGGGSNWLYQTNFGANALTPSTTVPVWVQGNFYASSTARMSTTTFVGQIGVGTSSPMTGYNVVVDGGYLSAANSPTLDFFEKDTSNYSGLYMSNNDLILYSADQIFLDNPVSMNGVFSDIVPSVDNSFALGSGSFQFTSLFLDDTGCMYFGTTCLFSPNAGLTGIRIGNGSANGVLSSFGNFDLVLQTGNVTTGNLTIQDGANGDFVFSPNGSGAVGIGSSTPNQLLSVAGDTWINGTATTTNLVATSTFRGAGLTDCDNAATSKLLWDITTGQFSCGTDQTGAGGGITSLGGQTGNTQTFASSSPASGGWGISSSADTHTLTIPTAGLGSPLGLLSSTDWSTFNGKVSSTSIDTIAELEALLGGTNVIVSGEIDTLAELETIMGGINILAATEIDTMAELEAIVAGTNIIEAAEIDTIGELETLLGGVNVILSTEVDAAVEALTNVVLAAASVWDFGGAASVEIPNGASPTVDATGEIALDTTSNFLLAGDSGGTVRVYADDDPSLFSVTIASTSAFFGATGNTLPIPKAVRYGRDITVFKCYVVGGTSLVVNVTDGTNDTETITCGTTMTTDSDVATNSTFTADELWSLERGAITGTPDYLVFEAYGYITRD